MLCPFRSGDAVAVLAVLGAAVADEASTLWRSWPHHREKSNKSPRALFLPFPTLFQAK